MWDGVVESGKCITIYYDISGFVKVRKKQYLSRYVVDFKGFRGVNKEVCNIGVRIHSLSA